MDPHTRCALPALWKGILYDPGARDAVWSLVGCANAQDRNAALTDVAAKGLSAEFAGRPVLEVVRDLVSISESGLKAMISRGEADASETGQPQLRNHRLPSLYRKQRQVGSRQDQNTPPLERDLDRLLEWLCVEWGFCIPA